MDTILLNYTIFFDRWTEKLLCNPHLIRLKIIKTGPNAKVGKKPNDPNPTDVGAEEEEEETASNNITRDKNQAYQNSMCVCACVMNEAKKITAKKSKT